MRSQRAYEELIKDIYIAQVELHWNWVIINIHISICS